MTEKIYNREEKNWWHDRREKMNQFVNQNKILTAKLKERQ